MPQYGQMLDCAGAMRWLPDAPDPQDQWFEIRTGGIQPDTLFDHDRDETTAIQRAEIMCGLTRSDINVYRCTRWEYDGEVSEECIKCLGFDADNKTVGEI